MEFPKWLAHPIDTWNKWHPVDDTITAAEDKVSEAIKNVAKRAAKAVGFDPDDKSPGMGTAMGNAWEKLTSGDIFGAIGAFFMALLTPLLKLFGLDGESSKDTPSQDAGAQAQSGGGKTQSAGGGKPKEESVLDRVTHTVSSATHSVIESAKPMVAEAQGMLSGFIDNVGKGAQDIWNSGANRWHTMSDPVKDRANEAMAFFQSKGLTKEQAAGITSSLIAESGHLDPRQKEIGGTHEGLGLAQWGPPRQKDFERKFGHKMDDGTIATTVLRKEQLEFFMHELDTTYKTAGDKLRETKTAGESAAVVVALFEKPKYPARDSVLRAGLAEQIIVASNDKTTPSPAEIMAKQQADAAIAKVSQSSKTTTVPVDHAGTRVASIDTPLATTPSAGAGRTSSPVF